MRSVLVGVIWCLLVAQAVRAQPEPIVSRDIAVFAAGVDPATGGQPIAAAVNYPASVTVCSQSKINPPAVVENPTQVRFDDPANVLLDCRIDAGPQLAAVPLGRGYRVAVLAKGAASTSAWSALSSPFDRAAGAVPVPSGVRLRKP